MTLCRRLHRLVARIPAPVRAGQLVAHEPERLLDPVVLEMESLFNQCLILALRESEIVDQFKAFLATCAPKK